MDDFQINIIKITSIDPLIQKPIDGFQISLHGQKGKKEINEREFFAADSELGIRVKKLQKDLRKYFDENP